MKTTYLVIKCGNAKLVDAVEELKKIISKKKSCWFAKFGQPIKFDKLDLENPNNQVVLCVAMMFEREYKIFPFTVNSFSNNTQPKRGTFPTYYKDNISKVGTWINVSEYEGNPITINDLLVKSSLHKLYKSIYKAKVGYFFCKHIKD